MNREQFFETINAQSAAYKEERQYSDNIAAAAATCRSIIVALRLSNDSINGQTVARSICLSSHMILIFPGYKWFMVRHCDHDGLDYFGMNYSDTMSFKNAHELGILPDAPYNEYLQACKIKEDVGKHSAGMKSLQEAISHLGEDKIRSLLK